MNAACERCKDMNDYGNLFKSHFQAQDMRKHRCDCLGEVNFALRQVKMEVWWSGGLVSDNFQSEIILKIKTVKCMKQ